MLNKEPEPRTRTKTRNFMHLFIGLTKKYLDNQQVIGLVKKMFLVFNFTGNNLNILDFLLLKSLNDKNGEFLLGQTN